MSDGKMVMTEHSAELKINKEELAPGIFVYRDVILGHPQLIPYIEQISYAGLSSWTKRNLSGNELETMLFDYPVDIKDPNDMAISFEERVSLVFAGYLGFAEKDYLDTLSRPQTSHENIMLAKHPAGTSFEANFDSEGSLLSVLYYLNDDYSGGLVEWPELGVSYQPKANEMLIFPSSPDFKYSISEIKSGVKYSVLSYLK